MLSFEEWLDSQKRNSDRMLDAGLARQAWQAAQQAERERAKGLVELARLYLDHYENYNITNHYQSDGDFTGFIAEKARAAIAKATGEINEP
jgi:hypothetical protein